MHINRSDHCQSIEFKHLPPHCCLLSALHISSDPLSENTSLLPLVLQCHGQAHEQLSNPHHLVSLILTAFGLAGAALMLQILIWGCWIFWQAVWRESLGPANDSNAQANPHPKPASGRKFYALIVSCLQCKPEIYNGQHWRCYSKTACAFGSRHVSTLLNEHCHVLRRLVIKQHSQL